jgi:hypothetical protein
MHPFPRQINRPDDFMAGNAGINNRGHAIFHHLIAVANSAGCDFQPDLACFWLRQRSLNEFKGTSRVRYLDGFHQRHLRTPLTLSISNGLEIIV